MLKHAFVVAGTHSGVGKTTLTLALMAHLVRRGFRVQPFKVGPDFIDPGLHSLVTGRVSRNLDGWMLRAEYNRSLFGFTTADADVAVVEGVMGLYDGHSGADEAGSTAQMAKWLGLPVLLIVDARSMARSVAALVLGYVKFDPGLQWAGCLLNRVAGEGHFRYLKEALETYLPNLPVLGWIPPDEVLHLPERHLGLVTAQESHIDRNWMEKASNIVSARVNVDLLLQVSRVEGNLFSASDPFNQAESKAGGERRIRIAVPMDPVFCFYYQDNLDILRSFGADLVFIKPLYGDLIPDDVDGVYMGGGYPELHARELSRNTDFFNSLKSAVSRGAPVYAECGGLMVLSRFIVGLDGTRWPMAGLLPFGVRMLPRRKALGYVEVRFLRDCILGPKNTVVRGHEFHYSEIYPEDYSVHVDTVYEIASSRTVETRFEGYSLGTVLASYVHLHWGSNPLVGKFFAESARRASISKGGRL